YVELKEIQHWTLGASLDPADILALERDDADLSQHELLGEAHILPVLVPAEGRFDPVAHRRAIELSRKAVVDGPSLSQGDLHQAFPECPLPFTLPPGPGQAKLASPFVMAGTSPTMTHGVSPVARL